MNSKKTWINGFCLICIFLCAPFFLSAQEADVQDLLLSAQEELTAGAFPEASLAFEKVYYFGGREYEFDALTGKALAQKLRGDYDDSLRSLRRIRQVGLNAENAYQLHYEIALCSFLSSKFIEAKSELLVLEQKLNAEPSEVLDVRDLLFLKIIIANEMRDWESGKVLMEEYVTYKEMDPSFGTELYGSEFPKMKDPHKAELWSTFIPGAGQIYAGSFWRGALNVITQAAVLGFGVYHLFEKFYFTAFFSGFALWQAFYFGGQTQAGLLTESNNQKRADEYNQKIKARLLAMEAASLKKR